MAHLHALADRQRKKRQQCRWGAARVAMSRMAHVSPALSIWRLVTRGGVIRKLWFATANSDGAYTANSAAAHIQLQRFAPEKRSRLGRASLPASGTYGMCSRWAAQTRCMCVCMRWRSMGGPQPASSPPAERPRFVPEHAWAGPQPIRPCVCVWRLVCFGQDARAGVEYKVLLAFRVSLMILLWGSLAQALVHYPTIPPW